MFDVNPEDAAPLSGALELTMDELNAVSGGDIRAVFQVSKTDSWVISSDGASRTVTHFHGESWQA